MSAPKKKRAKRRLLIDIRIPDAKGFRMTIRADDTTVAPEVLDKWVPVCERLIAEASNAFHPALPAAVPSLREDREP